MYKNLLKPLLKDVWDFIADTLFPIVCVWCEKEGQFLCTDCQRKLKKLGSQECIICRKPSPLGLTHIKCKSRVSPDGLVSCYDYRDSKLSKMIIEGKYYYIQPIYAFLGQLAAKNIQEWGHFKLFEQNFSLVPIPLSASRQKWRGFNQAEILCQSISKELNIPVSDILIRQKHTKTQKDLKRSERLKNVKGAFAINQISNTVRGQNFIVVDDVITTGSTIMEAAKTLKIHGAGQVWCITVARD